MRPPNDLQFNFSCLTGRQVSDNEHLSIHVSESDRVAYNEKNPARLGGSNRALVGFSDITNTNIQQ